MRAMEDPVVLCRRGGSQIAVEDDVTQRKGNEGGESRQISRSLAEKMGAAAGKRHGVKGGILLNF